MPRDHDLPTALATAAATALRDLVNPAQGIDVVDMSYAPSDASSDAWIVTMDFADGSQTAFGVETSQSAGATAVAVADGLQQGLIDHFWVTVPPCPWHQHPLVPQELGGIAVWSCPQTGEAWPIGSLA
jgi:hypothetical protein